MTALTPADTTRSRRCSAPERVGHAPVRRSVQWVFVTMVGFASIAAACSSDDLESTESTVDASSADETLPDLTADADAVAGTDAADDGVSEVIEFPTVDGPVETFTSSAMGGVRFDMSADHQLFRAGDSIAVTLDQQTSFEWAAANLELITQSTAGQPIMSTADYLDLVRAVEGAKAEPNGTELRVLGYSLQGYDVTRPADAPDESLYIFAIDRAGSAVQSGVGPTRDETVFLTETPSGVLVARISGNGNTALDNEELRRAFGTLVGSAEFTGPGLDPALPAGEDLLADREVGPEPVPAEPSGAVEVLGAPFSPVEPGRWELSNFSLPLSIELPAGWFVQPNFPGFVVLTDEGSGGPNDRDLVWLADVVAAVPVSGPVPAGASTPITDVEAFLAAPPAGINIADVERTEVVGSDGSTQRVIAFGITAADDSACSVDDPCDVALVTSYGAVREISSVHRHRIWWFPDHPAGQSMAVAAAPLPGGAWVDEAIEAMTTLQLP